MKERFGYTEDLQMNLKHEEMQFEKLVYARSMGDGTPERAYRRLKNSIK